MCHADEFNLVLVSENTSELNKMDKRVSVDYTNPSEHHCPQTVPFFPVDYLQPQLHGGKQRGAASQSVRLDSCSEYPQVPTLSGLHLVLQSN